MSEKAISEKNRKCERDDNDIEQPESIGLLKTCSNVSSKFSHAIDRLFYRLGYTVASHPVKTILLSLLFTLICSSGYFRFHSEKNPLKLWIPPESKFLRDTEWLMKSFEEGFRLQSVLITAPDVLQPNVLHKLSKISKEVMGFSVQSNNKTLGWNDVCFQIPNIAEMMEDDQNHVRRNVRDSTRILSRLASQLHRMNRTERPFNPSVDVAPFIFCAIVEALPMGCMIQNFLEMWNFEEDTIENLTKQDILNALHTTKYSMTTGHESNFERLLVLVYQVFQER